jgi:AraC-like DNA-binding protein
VKFSQPVSRISLDIADSQRPFTAANRELAVSGDRILEGMIKDLNSSNIIGQVKRAIIDTLPSGTPDQDEIAKQVLVSSRTLQRRLAEENTNLRTLVLEVRRELAAKYISDRTMPLAEISYMLGFSDTSSFSRAFKQWTGQPPVAFRQNLSA